MAELPPLKYGKVVGRFLANVADGPDIGELPEFPPLAGTITFTAEAPKVLVAGAQPPATYVQLPEHYVCSLDEFGYLTWRGTKGVRLVAPGPETNPNAWTWRVSFDLTYDGERVDIAAFSFTVPEYVPGPDPQNPDAGSFGLVDLTLVSPVPASPGNAVVVGPRGEGLQIDGVVATYAALPAAPAEGAQYVVQADGRLYVYHAAAGGWLPNGQGVVIKGADGTSSTWLTGAGTPSGGVGVDTDMYLDTSTGGVYRKSGGAWTLQANITGPAAADLTPTGIKTANYTPADRDLVPVDCTGGSVTVALPAAPIDKFRVGVTRLDSSGNTVFINRGGSDRFSSATGPTSLTLALIRQSVIVQYQASSGIWHILSGDIPLEGLDSWYAPKPRQIATGAGLTGGGDLSADRIIEAVFGTAAGTVCAGNDGRLSDARTPTAAGQIYDFAFVAQTGTRAVGAGNVVPQGIKLRRNIRISEVTYRGSTADASGNLGVELRANGSQITGTNLSIDAANQTAGAAAATATGTWDVNAGQVLTVHVTGVGTTPGQYLIADIKAVTR